MDLSRELSSLKRRVARLAIERTVPDLEMPVYFEGEEAPEVKVWELPDGNQIALSLPKIFEKERKVLNLMDQKNNKELDFNVIDERLAAGWYVYNGQRKRYLKSISKKK